MIKREILLEIARHYGTPVYVYDLEQIRAKFRKLRDAFSSIDTDIHFAVKANHNPFIIKTIDEEGGKFDTVSLEEVKHLSELGIDEKNILYTPSCPSKDELKKALDTDIAIHIGALELLEWIGQTAPEHPLGLRLNPGLDIGGNKKIATAHQGSKFGIPWTLKNRILKTVDKYRLRITGLHTHLGSDVSYDEVMRQSIDFLFEARSYFPRLEYLDIGGGFKIKYHPDDKETDLKALAGYIRGRTKKSGEAIKIKIEPGKFLVAEAGYFLMQVNFVKKTPGKTFACVNTGFNHFIRPMYYGAYHPVENLSRPGEPESVYDVVGNLCEEDTFAYDRKIARIRENDILVLKNAGAYGYVMASHYNLRPLPKEIVVDGHRIIET